MDILSNFLTLVSVNFLIEKVRRPIITTMTMEKIRVYLSLPYFDLLSLFRSGHTVNAVLSPFLLRSILNSVLKIVILFHLS